MEQGRTLMGLALGGSRGCQGLVSGDAVPGQTGLGVAASAVPPILIVMIGDSPQKSQGNQQPVVPAVGTDRPWALLVLTGSLGPHPLVLEALGG